MKKQLATIAFTLLFSCTVFSLETSQNIALNDIVTDFLKNTQSLKDSGVKNPISTFSEAAETKAIKKIVLTKENIESVLKEAKNYKHCVIIVGIHTIVKISDLNDCKASGVWGTCMPKAEGFVKKGTMTFMNDYVNMIIGRPDNQKRMVYFFN